jgi:hypothetical protein
MGHEVQKLAVELVDKTELSRAELCCDLGNHVEHRLHVGWKATDDPQHLRGRRLLVQRLVPFAL